LKKDLCKQRYFKLKKAFLAKPSKVFFVKLKGPKNLLV